MSVRARSGRVSRGVRRLLAVALAFAAAQSAQAGTAITQSLPVPVRVERERVRTTLLLQFDLERYDLAFDAFSRRPADAAESAFRNFVLALKAGDAAKLALLRPGDKPAELNEILSRFHEPFAGSQQLHVVARVYVRDGQVFVWEWAGPNGPVRRAFSVTTTERGETRVELVTSSRPLETLIVDVLQQQLLHPDDYAARTPHTRYHLTLGSPAARPGAHPVVLHFDGQPSELELFAPGAAAPSAPVGSSVLTAFAAAYAAFGRRDFEAFFEAYTPDSRDKQRAWFKDLTPSRVNAYYADITRPRHVVFVLDGGPLALVFYTVGADTRLHYEYLSRDGEQSYKLTNAYIEGFLDDLLTSDELFATDVASFRKHVLGVSTPK